MKAVRNNEIKYLIWLNGFTTELGEITDAMIPTKEYTQLDIYNYSSIENIYKMIDEFAYQNYLSPYQNEYEKYYCIEYWGAYYIIGERFHIEFEHFCKRVDALENPINMCDVLDFQNTKEQEEEKSLQRILKVPYEN